MKKGKKVVIVTVVILGIGVGAVFVKNSISNAKTIEEAENIDAIMTDYVTRQDISDYINASGTIESENVVHITTTLDHSKVDALNVDLGDSVKNGDVLCVFSNSEIQSEYNTLKAAIDNTNEMNKNESAINKRNLDKALANKTEQINAANEEYNKAVEARDNAYAEYNRMKSAYDAMEEKDFEQGELLNEKAADLPALDEAVNEAYNNISVVTKSADDEIQQAQDTVNAEKYRMVDTESLTQLEKLEKQLNNCTVTSPMDGIITALNVKTGSIPSTEALMTVSDISNVKVCVNINEDDILKVNEGMKVSITTNATGEKKYNGVISKVVKVAVTGESTDEMQTPQTGYTAEIKITDNDEKLLLGMKAKCRIIIAEKTDVLTVPYDAIISEDEKDYVYVVTEKDGSRIAKKTEVTKGVESGYYTEISGDGIAEDTEIVASAENVEDGDVIE